MKKPATFFFLPFVLSITLLQVLSSTVSAQITLNESDFSSNIGTQYTVDLISYNEFASVIPLIEQSGEDQTWDLTQFAIQDSVYGNGTIEFFSSFDGNPGADENPFSDANVMALAEFETTFDVNGFEFIIDQIIYSYNSLSADGLLEFGNIQAEASAPNDPVVRIENTPAKTVFPFPLAFGTSWNYNYTSEVIQEGSGTSSTDYSVVSEVDGWGDVVIGNTTIPALRVMSSETTEIAGLEYTSVTVIFLDENGFEFANLSADSSLSGEGYFPDSANLQITAYSQINAVSAETTHDIPQSIRLNQNFPNPFNPATQISYQLDSPTEVSLTIYSLTGQKVQTLVSGEFKQAGEYNVPFDAGNLASGIYIYRLRAGDQMFTRTMTLLR